MVKREQQLLLAKLVGLQMSGYIVVEVLFGVLISLGLLPTTLSFHQQGVVVAEISTVYVVVIGLVAVLFAGFWVALLVEVFDIFTIAKFDINFKEKKRASKKRRRK